MGIRVEGKRPSLSGNGTLLNLNIGHAL